MRTARATGPLLAGPVTVWLAVAFAAPLCAVVLLSLHADADPFAPLFASPSLAQFAAVVGDAFYWRLFGGTLALAATVTAMTVALGYPLALWLVRLPPRWRRLGFAVVLVPLLTNIVVRSLGIVLLLAPDGILNGVLGLVGLPPLRAMLYTPGAVAVALTQVFLPFMALSLYDVLRAVPPNVHEAAESLGASRAVRLLTVDLPLSLPGLRAGVVVVFLTASTAYVSATILGGKKVLVVGMIVWQEALQNLDAPLASALALVTTLISLAFAAGATGLVATLTPWRSGRPARPWAVPSPLIAAFERVAPILGPLALATALILLLLPLALVTVQSFNDVPQATVAGFRAFTWRWYERALFGGAYLPAFVVSAELAAASAVTALALALPAAFALARYPFRGLGPLAVGWMLPLSLPHVALGVGMLRLLQAYTQVPAFFGLMAVHVVLILPLAITLLRASVEQLDKAQEEAASSLGAGPVRRFLMVTLPGLAPGLTATGVMSVLLSLEEVTVTNFLTTARTTTLPVRIYAEAAFSLEPTVHAVSTLLIVVTTLALLALGRIVRLDALVTR